MNIDFHNLSDTIQSLLQDPSIWFSYMDTLTPSASSSLLITEFQAKDYNLSSRARTLWNQIVLKSSTWNPSYRLTIDTLYPLLVDLRTELAFQSEIQYPLHSHFDFQPEPFIGREDLLLQIHNAFTTQSAIFLYGIGGIGKSALARMFALYDSDNYDVILYTTYKTTLLDLVVDDEALAIEGLQFHPQGKRGEKKRYFLQKLKILKNLINTRTLLIIDNFDTLSDSNLKYLLELPCHLLFTTRTHPTVWDGYGIHVPAFDTPKLRQALFVLYAPDVPYTPALDALLAAVHGHTLTIKLLAAYTQTQGAFPIEFTQQDASVLRSMDLYDQILTVFRTSHLNREEKAVLRNLSIMPLNGIPLHLYTRYCKTENIQVIHSLIQRNLIEYDGKQNIRLHPLIAQIIRDTEHPSFQNCWPYASTLCQLAANAWWMPLDEKRDFQDLVFTLMQYLTVPLEPHFEDIIYLVDVSWQFGNFTLAESYSLMLHTYALSLFGSHHYLTAKLRHSIGSIYFNSGNFKKAGEWFMLAYTDYKDCPDPDIRLYGNLLLKAGRTQRLFGQYEQSFSYLQQAVSFLSASTNNKSWIRYHYLVLLDTYLEFTFLYLDLQQPQAAYEYCQRYLNLHTQQVSDYRSNLWHLHYCMGLCLFQLGHYEDADSHLHTSLDLALTYHGLRIYILKVLEALGDTAVCLHHTEEATEWYQKELNTINRYFLTENALRSRLRGKLDSLKHTNL